MLKVQTRRRLSRRSRTFRANRGYWPTGPTGRIIVIFLPRLARTALIIISATALKGGGVRKNAHRDPGAD